MHRPMVRAEFSAGTITETRGVRPPAHDVDRHHAPCRRARRAPSPGPPDPPLRRGVLRRLSQPGGAEGHPKHEEHQLVPSGARDVVHTAPR
jgi:hypothetical protein